jgi:2-polyprenyl-6-methoxyphenol hydroxylase-like FAD-dependent oxidoreductase
MPFRPRIAIVGGGPSGLALGLLLQQCGICPTIYELRSKPTAEELAKPSGMLDLHEESGLRVMRECGLWDGFQAAVGDCS